MTPRLNNETSLRPLFFFSIRIPAYSTPSKPASASFLQPDRPQRARQPPQPWFKVNPLFKTETPSRATSSLDPAVFTSKREGGAGGALG
jgi:hypothetical protein